MQFINLNQKVIGARQCSLRCLQVIHLNPKVIGARQCSLRDASITYPLPVSRNHQGRRGPLLTSATIFLPSLTVFGCSLTAGDVETGPLSDVVFPYFLLPSSFSVRVAYIRHGITKLDGLLTERCHLTYKMSKPMSHNFAMSSSWLM